ncbi:MAG: hypothetical protein U1F76_23545 [Candidatus Competibacteraceae bacterium]
MSNNTFDSTSQLPANIHKYFMQLYSDVVLLKNKWSFYLKLFGEEKNSGLLSELAPASFQIIEDSLRNDMIMVISRLADPPKSCGYENLSLEALIEQLDKTDIQPLCTESA